MRPIGRSARWQEPLVFRTRRSAGYGTPSACNPIALRGSSCPAIICSSIRSATSSVFICRLHVPPDLDVHIVMDNHAAHKTASIKNWLMWRPRYHAHFTPTSASWINQVERWFAEFVHTSTAQLEADIKSFIERHNENPKPYRWTKSADDILASVRRFCQKANNSLYQQALIATRLGFPNRLISDSL
ncbi:transposase [Ensifer adhaerens]